MLTDELNDILTRVGRGTPMGEVFRRFWMPAVISAEIEKPDSPPVRIRILGEDLLAFRDTSGRVGVIEAYCSHRLAPLFFGRNEDCGLRCAYHGWKFDVDGKCVDMPNAPERDVAAMKARAHIKAYSTHEAGGIVWVYMGPKEVMPPVPNFEWMRLPSEQLHVSRWLQRSNYSVGMEGEIDSSHISFLHKEFVPQQAKIEALTDGRASDGAPKLTLRETEYGFTYGARRKFGEDDGIWRMTHWLAPMFSLIPGGPGEFLRSSGRAWVPIDDDHTTTFSFWFRADGPLGAEREMLDSGVAFPPRYTPGRYTLPGGSIIDTFLPAATKDNDFLVDRDAQRTQTFTGIWGANDQDRSLQESMQSISPEHPGIVNRQREHLMAMDLAIVAARNILIRMASDLEKGIEPNHPKTGSSWNVRAISKICSESDFDKFIEKFAEEIKAPPTLPTSEDISQKETV